MRTIKHIQTGIDMNTYDNLRHIAEANKMPLKETIREAIVEYIKSHEKDVMKDSLFGIVGSFSTEEGNWSERDDWRE